MPSASFSRLYKVQERFMNRLIVILLSLVLVSYANSSFAADLSKKNKRLSTIFDISKYQNATVVGIELVSASEKNLLMKDKSVQIDFGHKKKKKDLGSFYITNRNYGGKSVINTNLQSAPSAFDRHTFFIPNDMETLHVTVRFIDGNANIRHILLLIKDPNDKKRPYKKLKSKRLK